jgi:hypothetical protein
MTGLERAILGLQQALDSPREHHAWRALVRRRVAAARDALVRERAEHGPRSRDAWLAAREHTLVREQAMLLSRLALLGRQVLHDQDAEAVRLEAQRLIGDLERHRQRLNDLVYDSVSLELGGSE